VLVDVVEDFGRGTLSGVAVIFLGGQHAHELATPVAPVAEFKAFLGRQRTHNGGDDGAEMGEDAGVDGVGFGELADTLGEVADRACVDDNGGQARSEQGPDGRFLVGAGGLEDDPVGGQGADREFQFRKMNSLTLKSTWHRSAHALRSSALPSDFVCSSMNSWASARSASLAGRP
jgi:hypothetical protein